MATKKKAKVKTARKKRTATASESVNKSDVIRKYAAEHRSAGPTEVSRAMAEQGIKVSAAFVSTVLANQRRKAGKTTKRRSVGRPPAASRSTSTSSGTMVAVSDLMAAKKLVEQAGGVDRAKAALDALSKLQ